VTDILKIATAAQDGHQELDQFGLRLVVSFALGNRYLFQSLNQADLAGIQPPRHEHGMGSSRDSRFVADRR